MPRSQKPKSQKTYKPAQPPKRRPVKEDGLPINDMPSNLYEAHKLVCGDSSFGHSPPCPANANELQKIYENCFSERIDDPDPAYAGKKITPGRLQQAIRNASDTGDKTVNLLLAHLAGEPGAPVENPVTDTQIQVLYYLFETQKHVRLLAPFDTNLYPAVHRIW